jgi:hypothetical protein
MPEGRPTQSSIERVRSKLKALEANLTTKALEAIVTTTKALEAIVTTTKALEAIVTTTKALEASLLTNPPAVGEGLMASNSNSESGTCCAEECLSLGENANASRMGTDEFDLLSGKCKDKFGSGEFDPLAVECKDKFGSGVSDFTSTQDWPSSGEGTDTVCSATDAVSCQSEEVKDKYVSLRNSAAVSNRVHEPVNAADWSSGGNVNRPCSDMNSASVRGPERFQEKSRIFCSQPNATRKSKTLIDNAADLSIVNSENRLEQPHEAPTVWLTGVNGISQPYSTRGIWRQMVDNEGTIDELTENNALLVRNSPQNILALKVIENDTNTTIRRYGTMKVIDNESRKAIMTAKRGLDGMYYLNTPRPLKITALPVRATNKKRPLIAAEKALMPKASATALTKEKFDILHKRLGHPSANRLKFSVAHNLFADMKPTTLKLDQLHHECVVCDQAKMPRARVKFFHERKTYEAGECIHADIIVMPPSRRGYKNVLLMTDDRSNYFFVQILKTRAVLHTCIRRLINLIKTQHNTSIKTLRTDNEFITSAMEDLAGEHGIVVCPSPPYEKNFLGQGERANRTIQDIARALLMQANFPIYLWP